MDILSEYIIKIEEAVSQYDINLLNLMFIVFTVVIILFGSLINLKENRLPVCIRQAFRYGKHSHKGAPDPLVKHLEVPKAWFKHFYIFAFTWSCFALFLILKSFILKQQAPEYVLLFLDLVAGGKSNRKVQIDSTNALIAIVLMFLQCGRRFYETNFVQIFSKKSKMNLSHYMVGYLHYFGAMIALLANTEGFVRGSQPSAFAFKNITIAKYICLFLFHVCWKQQYKSNMILVNLRKNSKTGKVVTENHLMPKGGMFEFVSSPHMFFEIFMYIILLGFLWPSTTWRLVVLWVLSNQSINAILTHRWYKENFHNYPKNRKALIPFLV